MNWAEGTLIAWKSDGYKATALVTSGAARTAQPGYGITVTPEECPPGDGLWLWEGELAPVLGREPMWSGKWRRLRADEAVVLASGANPLNTTMGEVFAASVVGAAAPKQLTEEAP